MKKQLKADVSRFWVMFTLLLNFSAQRIRNNRAGGRIDNHTCVTNALPEHSRYKRERVGTTGRFVFVCDIINEFKCHQRLYFITYVSFYAGCL